MAIKQNVNKCSDRIFFQRFFEIYLEYLIKINKFKEAIELSCFTLISINFLEINLTKKNLFIFCYSLILFLLRSTITFGF